jgi:hypothetical protein
MASVNKFTHKDIAALYINGKTKEEIFKIYHVDGNEIAVKSPKHKKRQKINNFFKVAESAIKLYSKRPRARVCHDFLIYEVNDDTLLDTHSVRSIINALESQGWDIKEVTQNKLKDKLVCKEPIRRIL